MEKMFSDLERSVFRMVNRQVATIAWLESDSVVVVTQYLSVLPYIWRLLQRLRQYKDTKERTSIFNVAFLQYSSSEDQVYIPTSFMDDNGNVILRCSGT
ncbi:SPX and EXS domain-containing protein 1 [Quillaja saponaria]|uniref:SPX and EXS domain-containing protein 1 n=1 Tax=Quillaja saponaria TaxID=32244 RepID=A0AAD7PNG3_QUISA|nr:SPX and EXS domain-containing protein 1 [Quillaja saponaria]